MTELVATVSSQKQLAALLQTNVDRLYLGEDEFGLRLPHSFQQGELPTMVEKIHTAGRKVTLAVNAIFHNDRIKKVGPYLKFLAKIGVDEVAIGDPGAIYLLQKAELDLPYLYDAADLVTSSRQVNFWGKHGAQAVVLAHELPYQELTALAPRIEIPVELTVYGAIAIHQSGRTLLKNYGNFVQEHLQKTDRARGLFIAPPHQPDAHYSIYEDRNGTHIFADQDLNLMKELPKLAALGLKRWKLDGLYADETTFAQTVALFDQARVLIDQDRATDENLAALSAQVADLQVPGRSLSEGFFNLDPNEVK